MTNLIERLRKNGTDQYDPCGLCDEAADEIRRLRAKVEYQEATIKSLSVDKGEDAAEIERLKTRDAVFLEKITEQSAEIERLRAFVDAAKRSRETDEYGLLSVEKGWELDRALAALEDDK